MPNGILDTIATNVTTLVGVCSAIWAVKSVFDKYLDEQTIRHKNKMDASVQIAKENSVGEAAIKGIKIDVEALKEDLEDDKISKNKIISRVAAMEQHLDFFERQFDKMLRLPSSREIHNFNNPQDPPQT